MAGAVARFLPAGMDNPMGSDPVSYDDEGVYLWVQVRPGETTTYATR